MTSKIPFKISRMKPFDAENVTLNSVEDGFQRNRTDGVSSMPDHQKNHFKGCPLPPPPGRGLAAKKEKILVFRQSKENDERFSPYCLCNLFPRVLIVVPQLLVHEIHLAQLAREGT